LDDELPGLTYLKLLCEQITELEVVRAFNDPTVFLRDFPLLESDVCILDIEMPGINGINLAGLLKGKPVIFITAYKEFALDAFELDAIDYIQKPFTLERLRQAVQKALRRKESTQEQRTFIQLNTDRGKTLIYFDQLMYIRASEIDSRDKIAQMQDNSTILLKNISFGRLFEILPPHHFCQVNKKEIIAFRSVRFFSHNEITTKITNNKGQALILKLSEMYRKNFIQDINL
jgi:DNA-binding LytR/AlgR family response regulator